jgi:hypothetical protein
VYGTANPTLDGTLSGVVSGDGITASYGTTAVQGTGVGAYPITASLNDPNSKLGNYTVSSTNGTLTITPAPLTITASNVTRPVGTSNPSPLPVNYVGFVNGDTATTALGNPLPTTSANVNSAVGTYPITWPSTPTNANYTIAYVGGTLTVTSGYGWNGFLQPINDTAHQQTCNINPCTMSVFKAGSTVPVKFQLTAPNGTNLSGPFSSLPTWLPPTQVGTANLQVDETIFQDVPSTGTTVTCNSTGQCQYNWQSPKSSGTVWQIGVQLPDGSKQYVTLGLK